MRLITRWGGWYYVNCSAKSATASGQSSINFKSQR